MTTPRFTIISLILILSFKCRTAYNNNQETLQLVIATFRHGDRTNDIATTYPKDPHKNETYEPYGIGELTNEGKQREYKLGQLMRKRYLRLLGVLYKKEKLEALSTDYSRTKMSLQLVLAGLYPPNLTSLMWNKQLNWMPIPYNYVSLSTNRLLSIPYAFCPAYQRAYSAYKETSEGQNVESSFNKWYKYISDNSGLNVTEIFDLFGLYFGLTVQKEFNLKLPNWTTKVYPDYLTNAAIKNYELLTATPQLNQLSGGFLLKKIINDMVGKINGSVAQQNLKMYLYSAHEINVAGLLGAMNMFFSHIPPYGSCVFIELHKINETYFVKVFYQDYTSKYLKEMIVPGCSFICPLADFINLLAMNLPDTENSDPCIL